MFSLNKCLVRACSNQAVSTFDKDGNLSDGKNYCLDHLPDPGRCQQNVYDYIKSHDAIIGLNAPGMTFSDIDFSNKRFIDCNFMHCTFINVHSEGLISRMSMFDFAVFTDCNLIKCNMQFSSFAGSTFTHTIFTGSTLFQINFNGINSFQSSFDDSDLYTSRFIKAKLIDTSFRNCNLKRTVFHSIEHRNILFKMSNTRDADFDADGRAQFLDISIQPAEEIEGTGA